jgi:hypothetical protein
MDNLIREMRLCEKAGFGVSYGKWKATQPIKELPKKQESRTCLYCGKTIIRGRWDKGGQYCDNECSDAARRNRIADQKKYEPGYGYYGEPIEKKCEWCGKIFMARRTNHRYCHNNCAASASYYRRKDETEKARND